MTARATSPPRKACAPADGPRRNRSQSWRFSGTRARGAIGFPSDLLNGLGFDRLTRQSLLGTGRIEETGASAFLGVGPAGDTSVKPISGGFKGGQNFTKSETNSMLVDVTGDGIDDVVARQYGRLRYCGGLRDPDTHFVSYPVERCGWIEGISDLALSSTSTFSAGAEVTAYGSVFAGVGINRSKNDTYIYFTHRDADGLIDLAAYGQIYYGLAKPSRTKPSTVRLSRSAQFASRPTARSRRPCRAAPGWKRLKNGCLRTPGDDSRNRVASRGDSEPTSNVGLQPDDLGLGGAARRSHYTWWVVRAR